MHRRNWVRILLILMLLGISLAACQQPEPTATPVPTSTEAPPTTTPVPEAEEPEAEEEAVEGPAITVNGQAYTMEQLKAMEQLTIEVEHPDRGELEDYTGISILALLEDAGAEGGTVRFVADDGYEVEVPMGELTDQSILAYRTKGGLRSILPDSDSSLWVKGVITLETIPAEEEAAAEEPAVTVNGQAYTMANLEALEQVTIEVEHPDRDEMEEYTGVGVLALLEDAGAKGNVVRFVADDGYEVEVPMDELTDQSILAYRTKGGLRSVLPGSTNSLWVKGVITLETLTAEEETSAEEKSSAETETEAEEAAGGPIQVTDALGNEIDFESPPTRIVVAGKGSWMVGHPLYLFPEAQERVLALETRGGNVSDFLEALYPGFAEKPHIEMDAGPEQIAPLKPDAVVIKSYMAERLGKPLQELGIPVVHVALETPEQFFADIETFGEMFANEKRSNEINTFYKERIEYIEGQVALLSSQKPRVLVIQHKDGGDGHAFTVPPASWMQTLQVEMAGGDPVWTEAAGSGWEVVSFDQIAAWNPEKILLITFGSDPEQILADLRQDPTWQELDALQNDELYAFPADYYGWDVPDPRWILGLTWTAKTLHPDLFADIDMAEEVYGFYSEMYGIDSEIIDELIISRITGDAGISSD